MSVNVRRHLDATAGAHERTSDVYRSRLALLGPACRRRGGDPFGHYGANRSTPRRVVSGDRGQVRTRATRHDHCPTTICVLERCPPPDRSLGNGGIAATPGGLWS